MSLIITNIGQLASYDSRNGGVKKLKNTQMVIDEGHIIEIGRKLPPADEHIDAGGRLVTPGFVDPHTHPVFAEIRPNEFEMRLAGKTYEDIANMGGGIKSSVRTLRRIDEEELVRRVMGRMRDFLRFGTTTLEAKSGYGLSTESELKSLRVLENAGREVPIDFVCTFLGAHDFPQEYAENRSGYVDLICNEMIPAVAEQGIAEFCDVFCEPGWFSIDDSRRILQMAKDCGMRLRIHADEFDDSGAASLAAEMGVLSADHLVRVSDEGIHRLAETGVVATLLPGTTFFLGRTSRAPARRLLDAGVEVALGSDFNPGTAMIQSMAFVMTLACLYLQMTVDEAFRGCTYSAAKSLGKHDRIGTVEPGKQADIVIWELSDLSEIAYHVDTNKVATVIRKGHKILDKRGEDWMQL